MGANAGTMQGMGAGFINMRIPCFALLFSTSRIGLAFLMISKDSLVEFKGLASVRQQETQKDLDVV